MGLGWLCPKRTREMHAVVAGDARKGLDRDVVGKHRVQYPHRLQVVGEVQSRFFKKTAVEVFLPRVPERGMPQIVPERDRLCQVLVESQRAGDRAGDLADLQRMGQARAVMVADGA